jgi:hypothetical protein
MLSTTSSRSGGRSVGIVRSRTQTMEFFLWIFKCGIEAHDEKFSSVDQLFSHVWPWPDWMNANRFLGHVDQSTPYYRNLMEPMAQSPKLFQAFLLYVYPSLLRNIMKWLVLIILHYASYYSKLWLILNKTWPSASILGNLEFNLACPLNGWKPLQSNHNLHEVTVWPLTVTMHQPAMFHWVV